METIIQSDNPFTQEQVKEGVLSWPKSLAMCKRRSALFESLQKDIQKNPDLTSDFKQITSLTKELESLLREPTATELEGYSQVIFTGSPWSGLNSLPFALILLSLYKSYIVPAFGVILPFLTWILPYIFLKAFFSMPITFTQYSKVLWGLWNGNLTMPKTPADFASVSTAIPASGSGGLGQLKTLTQNGWTLFTIAQGIYHPIQQARHFIRLESDCLTLAKSVCSVKEIAQKFLLHWKKYLAPWLPKWIDLCPTDLRRAFAYVIESPFWLKQTLRALGRFEVIWSLANRSDIVPVKFISSDRPVLMLKGIGDTSITQSNRVLSNLSLGTGGQTRSQNEHFPTVGQTRSQNEHFPTRQSLVGQTHAIVTGPNRGGKSSFMRSVYTSVCLAHAFGCSVGEKAVMTPIAWIANGLRLDDTPGKESMFEREVSFASGVLMKGAQTTDGFGLVLYDELFHSTNPPDATRTSNLFCSELWKQKNTLSIVSTHVYSLANEAPAESVKKLCLASWREKNKYIFSYKVMSGVCEVSSVDLLLKKHRGFHCVF